MPTQLMSGGPPLQIAGGSPPAAPSVHTSGCRRRRRSAQPSLNLRASGTRRKTARFTPKTSHPDHTKKSGGNVVARPRTVGARESTTGRRFGRKAARSVHERRRTDHSRSGARNLSANGIRNETEIPRQRGSAMGRNFEPGGAARPTRATGGTRPPASVREARAARFARESGAFTARTVEPVRPQGD